MPSHEQVTKFLTDQKWVIEWCEQHRSSTRPTWIARAIPPANEVLSLRDRCPGVCCKQAKHVQRDPQEKRATDHKTETIQKLTAQASLFQDVWDKLDDQGKPCGSRSEYLQRQAQDGVWGGVLELIALANVYTLTICALRSGKSSVLIGIGRNAIWLLYDKKHYTPCLPSAEGSKNSAARREHT